MKRRAVVKIRGLDDADTVRAYLPDNYKVFMEGTTGNERNVWIEGEDVAGWTLDDYVLPRLASGMIFGEEVEYPYED